MSDEPESPTGQGANEATLAKRLLELRQTLDRLSKEDTRLEVQQIQLQSQAAKYEDFTGTAQTAEKENLLRYAQERLRELQPHLTRVLEQRAQIKTQIDTLTQEQQTLLAQLGAHRAARQSALDTEADPTWRLPESSAKIIKFRRRRKPGRWILGFSILALTLIVVLTLSGVIRRPFTHSPTQTTNAPAPTTRPTVVTTPFVPNGTGPSNRQCISEYGLSCYSPEDIQKAFSLTPLYQQGYDGSGQTIVLLSTGNTDQVKNSLAQFDQTWGLPDPNLTIIQPFDPPASYTCDDGEDDLQAETILDVEWSHAIAPGAKLILLIGSNTQPNSTQGICFFTGLDDAIRYAVDKRLGQIISMSYGSSELGDISDTTSDKAAEQREYQDMHNVFKQAASENITIINASGDDGVTNGNDYTKPDSYWNKPNVNWPASDPDVLAVGGTRLNTNFQTGDYTSEVVWNEPDSTGGGASGGGLSAVFSEPDYQKKLSNQSALQGKRAIPDVAFPAANYLVYDTSTKEPSFQNKPEWTHWAEVGGTSASAPCWAGFIAIANQIRGKPLGLIQPALYSLNGKDMHDILSGDNSYANVQGYRAAKGFDLATGWGSPIASSFLPALAKAADQPGQNNT